MLFVEVDSVDKGCKVIIDLEKVIEIAPLRDGGCAIFFVKDPMIDPARLAMNVKNGYDEFKQFVVQTVTANDIATRIESISKPSTIPTPSEDLVNTINEVVKKKPGRPARVSFEE
jgi:ribosomal protein L10